MDPLTHGLLGASIGQAICGRELGGRALVWGAVLGMAPDLDILARPLGPLAEWIWHRGPTHGLWVGPAVGPLLGYGLWRRKGGALWAWIGLAALSLLSHPLLDLCTTYGTQLLAPFSNRRFAIDAVAIIDPVYSLTLAAGLAVGLGAGLASFRSRRAGAAALAISSLYLGLGLWVNDRAESIARAQLAAREAAVWDVTAYPTLLQLPFRRIVARSGDHVRIGWLSVTRPRPIEWEAFTQARGPLVEAARSSPEAQVLEWFAMGEATPRVEQAHGGSVVEFDDLRYGLPGAPRDGFWGVRVRLDAQARPLGPGERFERELSTPVSKLLRTIWRESLGLS